VDVEEVLVRGGTRRRRSGGRGEGLGEGGGRGFCGGGTGVVGGDEKLR